MENNEKTREEKTGNFIAYASLIMAILMAIHLFVVLDDQVVRQMLLDSSQKPTDNAIGQIINSFRFTGVMYTIAYATGILAIWSRHMYLWWFLFVVYTTNVLTNLVNLNMMLSAIATQKTWLATMPIIIVLTVSIILAIWMVVVSVKRKSTFNR
ncbi:hypothetical protein JCM2421_04950 [Staphylococcus auricularis]|uniref:hypothetical protein n=1 Tax=Staphylococcus auricularis TaxID=29379 RepID=UPI001BB2D96B|nr:hypothetical protein [Staphylococcus auricularis]BCU51723.1 hypothetical protein JCM2421_04950 [Staphylococcus auricularis]